MRQFAPKSKLLNNENESQIYESAITAPNFPVNDSQILLESQDTQSNIKAMFQNFIKQSGEKVQKSNLKLGKNSKKHVIHIEKLDPDLQSLG